MPVDAAVAVIAIRVALRILHVADERVVPVDEVEGAVGADLRIAGAEVAVGRGDEVFDPLAVVAGAVVLHLELQDAVHVDDAGVEEVALRRLGEVAAEEEAVAEGGPHRPPFVVDELAVVAAGVVLGAGEGRGPMLVGDGAVAEEGLGPSRCG